jgi:hypothetical protein
LIWFCSALTLNSQAFISFFFKQLKCKKVIAARAGSNWAQAAVDDVDDNDMQDDDDGIDSEVQAAVDAEGDGESTEDPAKVVQDDATVWGVQAEAIASAKAHHIVMTAQEEREALGLFLKVWLKLSSGAQIYLDPGCRFGLLSP